MRPLQVPTAPIIDNNSKITSEWLIFINELNRTIEKLNSESTGNDAAIEKLEKGKLERGIWYNKLLL